MVGQSLNREKMVLQVNIFRCVYSATNVSMKLSYAIVWAFGFGGADFFFASVLASLINT